MKSGEDEGVLDGDRRRNLRAGLCRPDVRLMIRTAVKRWQCARLVLTASVMHRPARRAGRCSPRRPRLARDRARGREWPAIKKLGHSVCTCGRSARRISPQGRAWSVSLGRLAAGSAATDNRRLSESARTGAVGNGEAGRTLQYRRQSLATRRALEGDLNLSSDKWKLAGRQS